jgi:1-acyl-sn-glycerol-3-phosphate acyltransferase
LSKITGFIKAFLLFIALLLIGGVLAVIAIPLWGNPRLNRWFVVSFSFATQKIVGIKIVFLNEERIRSRRPAVLIANHQSGLDLGILGLVCPSHSVIVAKKEIQYIPLFGWFFKAAGNVMINRSRSEDAKSMISRMTAQLEQKKLNLVIFPEGTRNRYQNGADGLLPFKKGAFYIGTRTGFPIIPVVCSSLKGKGVWENFELNGGIIVISVLPPVETRGLSPEQMDGLKDLIREQMLTELKRVNELAAQYEANEKDSKKSASNCCS